MAQEKQLSSVVLQACTLNAAGKFGSAAHRLESYDRPSEPCWA
jgi:hypothetical protein